MEPRSPRLWLASRRPQLGLGGGGGPGLRRSLRGSVHGRVDAGAGRFRGLRVPWTAPGTRCACDGIELLGVLAARERFPDAARLLAVADAARWPLRYLAPGFTANRVAAASAASQARNDLGDERFT